MKVLFTTKGVRVTCGSRVDPVSGPTLVLNLCKVRGTLSVTEEHIICVNELENICYEILTEP